MHRTPRERPLTRALLALALALAPGCRRGANDRGPVQLRDRSVTVAGQRIYVREVRSPAPASTLVIHGGPGLDHTYMRPYFDGLRDVSRVLYVDLRGHGRSAAPAESTGYTISAAADDLALLAEREGIASTDVIAHDFGAAVAVSLAARHPSLVRRLVLIAPLRDGAQVTAVADRSRRALGERGWREVQALTTPRGTLRDPHDLPRLFRALGVMWWHRTPDERTLRALTGTMIYRAEADERFLAAARQWNAALVAPEVRAPTLVICGAEDRTFLPAECRGLAEQMPHGAFVSVPRAGHLPFVERTAEVERAVRAFR
ncbi:MAG: alpha/beta hydrolase [Polyangiales bacterium]